jgi:hypothetical protein
MTGQTVRGVVSIRHTASGSKSEQTTVVLTTDERSWLLRRAGGPSFGVDEQLAHYDGKTVEVTGEAGPGVFLATEPPREIT